jgi:hypothetical protein
MRAFRIWDKYCGEWWWIQPGPFHNRASAEDVIIRTYRMMGIEGFEISELGFEIRETTVSPEPVKVGL